MKKAIVLLFFVGMFLSCETPEGERQQRNGYSIIVIDSCEYIEVSSGIGGSAGYYSITHKGNCKFCAERSKSK